jgi:hypothetical protein
MHVVVVMAMSQTCHKIQDSEDTKLCQNKSNGLSVADDMSG